MAKRPTEGGPPIHPPLRPAAPRPQPTPESKPPKPVAPAEVPGTLRPAP